MRRLRRSKRGQATAIGGILFLTIAIVLVGFLYEVYNTQAAMNQFDMERGQEKIAISGVLFGDTQTYSSPSSVPTVVIGDGSNPFSGIRSVSQQGTFFPIANMNFTNNADGWTFTKNYYGAPTTTGASGVFTLDTPSPGGTIIDFSYNPPVGAIAGANMNWTTRFYLNLKTLGVLTNTFLSYRLRCVDFDGGNFSRISILLEDPDKVQHPIESREVTSIDIGWVTYGGIRIGVGNFTESGWYRLIINVQAELIRLGTSVPRIRIFFDDIGIGIIAYNYVTLWTGKFTLNEDPNLITQLDIAYTGHYEDSSAVLKSGSFLRARSAIVAGSSISFGADYNLGPSEDFTTGMIDSTLKANSVLKRGSTIKAGSAVTINTNVSPLAGNITTGATATTLKSTSVLKAGSGLRLSSDFTLGTSTDVEIKNGTTLTVKSGSEIKANSRLLGTTYTSDTTLTSDVSGTAVSDDLIRIGSKLKADSVLTLLNDETLNADLVLKSGSVLRAGSAIVAGSSISFGADYTLGPSEDFTTGTIDSTLKTGSVLKRGSTIKAGSAVTIGVTVFPLAGDITTGTTDTTLSTTSVLAANTKLTIGSYYYYDPGTGSIKEKIDADRTLVLDVTTTTPSSINQYIYIFNVAEKRWDLFDRTMASTQTKTVRKTFTGKSVQDYVSPVGEVALNVSSFAPEPLNCIAEQLTITDFYMGSTDKVTISFTNTGGVNVRITSLWLVDPNNNHYLYDLNLPLSPGETKVQVINHVWSYGGYVFKAITDKGAIAKYEATA